MNLWEGAMKKNNVIRTVFSLPDDGKANRNTAFLANGFDPEAAHGPYKITLTQSSYLFGVLPVGSHDVIVDLYSNFDDAKNAVERRSRDNDNGYGGDKQRLVFGAMMALTNGHLLYQTAAETKRAFGGDNIAAVIAAGRKVKNEFQEAFGEDAMNDIRHCVNRLWRQASETKKQPEIAALTP